MEAQPVTLADWTAKLQQSFMLKWICNQVGQVDEVRNKEWEK
jgi:hypothetical protein